MPGTVRGLFYGDASQLAAQAIGILTCIVWVFVTFFAFFKVVEAIIGNRVSAEAELEGLDIPEMGAMAYPDFTQAPSSPSAADVLAGSTPAAAGANALKPVHG